MTKTFTEVPWKQLKYAHRSGEYVNEMCSRINCLKKHIIFLDCCMKICTSGLS